MADRANARERAADRAERAAERAHDMVPDLMGVNTRVSWSAILAGAVVALATFFVLTFFFSALGLTLTDAGVRGRGADIAATVAAIATVIVSLFLGGWVAAQMTVGENRQEAVIYGILTWAAVSFAMLWMVAAGVKAGFLAAAAGSEFVRNNERVPTLEQWAQQSGYTTDQVNRMKAAVDPSNVQAAAADPANQDRAREAAMYAAWLTLVGLLLSMAASIGGALVGRGIAFHLYPVRITRDDRVIVPANP
jgi:hypothetical protein